MEPARESRYPAAAMKQLYQDVAKGEILTDANVRSVRPGLGLAPKHLPGVLGRRAARSLKRGEPVDWSMLAQD